MKNIFFVFTIFSLVLFACNKEDEVEDKLDFDKKGMLTNYGNNVIFPRYQKLEDDLNKLQSEVANFMTTSTLPNFSAVKSAFNTTYLSWQAVSYFQFGPAENNVLRSVFNVFPVDTVKINANIASGSYVLGSAGNTDAIGLPALDYLLNRGATEAASFAYFSGNHSSNKKQYVQDVVNQLSVTLTNVVNEWSGSYKATFNNADGTSQGSSLSEMINALNYDFERFIRDGKVGIPLGVRSLGTPLPEKTEAYFGGKSLELCKESISQLKAYFNGGSGKGLDDYLAHLEAKHGSDPLEDKINSQFDAILVKLNALSNPISQEVVANQSGVQEVYNEMQKLVILLKVDLSSALSVLITYQDNDGD